MRLRFAVAGLLLLSACATEQRFSLESPPRPAVPTHAKPAMHAPAKPPANVPSAGPLKLAMVGNYMDAQEKDFRARLHAVAIMRVGDDLIVSIRDASIFSDGDELSSRGHDIVERMAELLRHYDRSAVQVGGYMDSALPPDRSVALSQSRAKTVAAALVSDGVSAQRVSAQGFGAAHLKIATGAGASEPRNRRIEIRVIAHPEG